MMLFTNLMLLHLLAGVFAADRAFLGFSDNHDGDSPTSSPVMSRETQVHCIDSELPLVLADPFDPTELTKNTFVLMVWVRVSGNEEQAIAHFLPDGERKISDEFQERVSIYQNWGIQISPVTVNDSATYRALLKSTTVLEERYFKVIVARAPKLASEKLSITSQEKGKGLLLQCGEVASLGQPPVNLEWQDKNGLVVDSSYSDGVLQLELNITSDFDMDKYSCKIDQASPASECIPDGEKDQWDTSYDVSRNISRTDFVALPDLDMFTDPSAFRRVHSRHVERLPQQPSNGHHDSGTDSMYKKFLVENIKTLRLKQRMLQLQIKKFEKENPELL